VIKILLNEFILSASVLTIVFCVFGQTILQISASWSLYCIPSGQEVLEGASVLCTSGLEWFFFLFEDCTGAVDELL
jgi:hypothetical protein